ncbi:flavoredoxin [mine drainage metagenome]|uniref:Flavoredoxin n=1 Tax=mine drainage metagenome TaxID=410659 RepID=A0A1J5SNL8_9ZZZZ
MMDFPLGKAFTLLEPGPVILVTTHDAGKNNVMTISWTMVLDFAATFAITTGRWNDSYAALTRTGNCVLAIPTLDLLDTVVGVGTCSGRDVDKFARFGLTALPARHVAAPLIGECLANIECRVVDIVAAHHIVVLQGVAAYLDETRRERRLLHAVGDGTFVADGRRFDRRAAMRDKLPEGV